MLLKIFNYLLKKFTKKRVKSVRTNGGGECCANYFENFLKNEGIAHNNTMPYAHEQNGVVERLNRSLLVSCRAMLHYHKLDKSFFAEAVKTANFLRNIVPCTTT